MAMGRLALKRLEKSSRARIWATVNRLVRDMTSVRVKLPNHSLCHRTSVRSRVDYLEELVQVGQGVFADGLDG